MRNLIVKALHRSSHRTSSLHPSGSPPKILITGGLGQLGLHLAGNLRKKYGRESVILTDVAKPSNEAKNDGPFKYLDVCDMNMLHEMVVNNDIDWVIHYAALLSALGEKNVALATKLNVQGVSNILELSRTHSLKVFIPSTIGAFGPDSPKHAVPDITVQRPRTIYGVSKVYAELLGEYYHCRYGTDFRSLRFPGIISSNKFAGAGTTDYAASSFHRCIKDGEFTCNLKPDTELPMMYIDDCTKSAVDILHAPEDKLTLRTYNVSAMSFTPRQLEAEIQARLPQIKFAYEIDQSRQKIADSWPRSLDDSKARADWNWNHNFDIKAMADVMFDTLTQTYKTN